MVATLLLLIEARWPLKPHERDSKRIQTNLILFVLGLLSLEFIVPVCFKKIFGLIGPIGPTLFEVMPIGAIEKVVLGVLIFDFKNYAFHRLLHKFNVSWRFHQVHHSDKAVDVFTTHRFHPVELIFGFIPGLIPVLLGVPLYSIQVIGVIALPWVLFQHSNIDIPYSLEKRMRYVFLTPNLHKLHHSKDPKQVNHNFGVIFSFWDRFFGTLLSEEEQDKHEISYGVAGFTDGDQTKSLYVLLKKPFARTST